MRDIELDKQLPVISINFDDVKASLLETTERYKNIIVTEEGLKDCKTTQKELAGVRNKLDTYRKDVKKEMEKPIKEFEGQCKELIQLIADAEQPIKEGINVFDNMKREQKRCKAQEIIANTIINMGLDKKYADQLTVLDKYLNLSGTQKSVVDDIEQRANMLKQQQNMEIAKLEILKATIETTIENVNKTIKTPLKAEDFNRFIETGWDTKRIIREINDRAELVREAEKPKAEVIEEVKLAEREVVQMPVDLKVDSKQVEQLEKESVFFVDVYVEHNYKMIQALSQFLKDNGYKYEVKEKGKK